MDEAAPIVRPPETMMVPDRRVILHMPDGRVLVRQIGYGVARDKETGVSVAFVKTWRRDAPR